MMLKSDYNSIILHTNKTQNNWAIVKNYFNHYFNLINQMHFSYKFQDKRLLINI